MNAVYKTIRDDKDFRNVPLVIIPEVEPGGNVSDCEAYFDITDSNLIIMHESTFKKKCGVPKQMENTIIMVHKAMNILKNRHLLFDSNFITTFSNSSQEIIDKLIKQFLCFEEVFDPRGKREFNGKASNSNDDLLISLIMTFFWSIKFLKDQKDERYLNFKNMVTLKQAKSLINSDFKLLN